MPRTRTIKPEFLDDEKLGSVSRDARLTFIGLLINSDDYGVVKGNPIWLKSKIFPYDDISLEFFLGWLKELEKITVILPFSKNGERFYYIRNFKKHQTINRPSQQRNPAPPEDILNTLSTHGALIEDSVSTHGVLIDETETETETETELELELSNKYINKRYISSSSPPADEDPQNSKQKVPYQQIIDLWNKHAPQPLPRATLTEKRKPKIRVAWKDYPSLEWWKDLFSDIVYSPWHSHQDRWQGNSFDWMLKNRTEMREKLNALKALTEPLPRGPTMNVDIDPPGIVIPSPDCPICRGGGLAPDGPCECLHPENPDDPYWTEHPEKLMEFKREKPI